MCKEEKIVASLANTLEVLATVGLSDSKGLHSNRIEKTFGTVRLCAAVEAFNSTDVSGVVAL